MDTVEDFDPKQVEDFIVELNAGGAAELRHSPGSLSAKWHLDDPTPDEEKEAEAAVPFGSASSDRHKAEAWLAWAAPDRKERAALQVRLRDQAKALVEKHWDEVCVVAKAPLERKTIDGCEAGLVIRIAAGDSESVDALAEYRALRGPPERPPR